MAFRQIGYVAVGILMLAFYFLSCKNDYKYFDHHKETVVAPIAQDGRAAWQKPNEVIAYLGDLSDKSVVDIGAGTGYFTFRLAFKAKQVLAIDIDTTMLKIVHSFKENLPSEIQSKITTKLVSPNDPMLQDTTHHLALIINTIGYIDDKKAYLEKVVKGLKKGGRVVIIDFKDEVLPIAAPTNRTDSKALHEIFTALGMHQINDNQGLLEYQYIISAEKP